MSVILFLFSSQSSCQTLLYQSIPSRRRPPFVLDWIDLVAVTPVPSLLSPLGRQDKDKGASPAAFHSLCVCIPQPGPAFHSLVSAVATLRLPSSPPFHCGTLWKLICSTANFSKAVLFCWTVASELLFYYSTRDSGIFFLFYT